MRVAIILLGEMRFENEKHFFDFKKLIEGKDVFISTYLKYESMAKIITSKIIINEVSLPQSNMYQWYHLDKVIKQWRDELINYDVLIRLRTDMIYKNLELENIQLSDGKIYAQTDQIFYGKPNHFLNVFDDMFDNVLNLYSIRSKDYYIPINFDNLLQSDSNADVKYAWINLPKKIYSTNINQIKENIIKENFLNRNDIESFEIEYGMKTGYNFTSERCFLIQSLNKGTIGVSEIKATLMNNRKEHKFIIK